MYAVFFFHSVLAIVERGTYVWRARPFPCFVLFQEIFVFPYMKRRIKCAHITTYILWSKRRKFQQQKKTAFNRFYYFVARYHAFLVLYDERKKLLILQILLFAPNFFCIGGLDFSFHPFRSVKFFQTPVLHSISSLNWILFNLNWNAASP